jgi:predicted extracellular nuclease
VKVAVLSKVPFKYSKEIDAPKRSRVRNSLEVGFDIKGKDNKKHELILIVNHWKSKGMNGFESKRIKSAKILKERIDELPDNSAFILTGDFNSNYDEHLTFQKNKYLNDTDGITGINHILKTVEGSTANNNRFVKHYRLTNQKDNEYLYNLWLELPEDDRWSHKFGRKKGTLDNMIISKGLMDKSGIEYKIGSYQVFRDGGTVDRKGRIYRWKTDKKTKQHLGEGYSDHLLIYADFEVK